MGWKREKNKENKGEKERKGEIYGMEGVKKRKRGMQKGIKVGTQWKGRKRRRKRGRRLDFSRK